MGQYLGRIEHVATSRGVRFGSLAELIGFIERVLADSQAEPEAREITRCQSPGQVLDSRKDAAGDALVRQE
jgi:hypothetical protein